MKHAGEIVSGPKMTICSDHITIVGFECSYEERLCNDNLERSYNPFITTNIYLTRAAYNSTFLIIYKLLSLIISP